MRKRERENPCHICGHYHKYEEGEACSLCGHRLIESAEKLPQQSAFPSEILPDFLYLGSYDNASRAEILKAMGISYILNTVPSCQVLYKNSFTYHCLKHKEIALEECVNFIDDARKSNSRILVHCMSGLRRSPSIVIAYLMHLKGWSLPQSLEWVKERRPAIEISQELIQQLQDYESKLKVNVSHDSHNAI